MSWREVLGVEKSVEPTYSHNSHNTHKTFEPSNSAHCADSANASAILMETLSSVCHNLDITPTEVLDVLAPEDIKDWHNGDIKTETLTAFSRSLIQRREMNQGRVPTHFTERAICKLCGPVWLWFNGELDGCPWCWNRVVGQPIPRP